MGSPRLNTMAEGETIMPVPHGVISTSTGPAEPTVAPAVEETVEEAVEVVEEVLPEAEADDL